MAEDPNQDVTNLRDSALAAFSHEIRTPLTSIRMVLDLGGGGDGAIVLDGELSRMMMRSVDDLETLADGLQELSRIERGRLAFEATRCSLDALADAVADAVAPELAVRRRGAGAECSADRVAALPALAAIARAVNRSGEADGVVYLELGPTTLLFRGTAGGGAAAPIGPDLGFELFRAVRLLEAMGSTVVLERSERALAVEVTFPAP